MIKSKTVFIVGAGASQEVGLPTGVDFKGRISDKINIQYEDGYERSSGDFQIDNAIREQVRKETPQHIDINPYLQAAWKICDALPQALSIDNVLDAHTDDKRVQLCGKLGIVKTILEAERNSKLFVEEGKKVSFLNIENTWYVQLLKLMTENVRKTEVGSLFENISFVTFNYDRCIEQYFFFALKNYYALTDAEAVELIGGLNIYHAYGQVGSLNFHNTPGSTGFGETRTDLLAISSGIKTFTEQEADISKLSRIRNPIAEADTLVFLGFAFHELNMQLLNPGIPTNTKRIFATAKSISNADCDVVRNDINGLLNLPYGINISLNNNLTCFGLFETYWRSLSR